MATRDKTMEDSEAAIIIEEEATTEAEAEEVEVNMEDTKEVTREEIREEIREDLREDIKDTKVNTISRTKDHSTPNRDLKDSNHREPSNHSCNFHR